MELEFDKEIDALLRKAKPDSPAAVGVSLAGHLDADELAAFAENALPDRTRQFYIAHLADCDACRKTLSGFIATNPEAAMGAASVSTQPVIAVKLPWYKQLFATPNLAYTMSALVVMFSGVIGLLVYENQMADRSSQVPRATITAPAEEKPVSDERPESFSNASSANSMANSATGSPIESVTKSGVEVGSASPMMSNSSTAATNSASAPPVVTENKPADDKLADAAKAEPNPPAAKPALLAQQPATKDTKEKDTASSDRRDQDEKKVAQKTEDRVAGQNSELGKMDAQNNVARKMSPATDNAKLRSAGPRQVPTQTQTQSQAENVDVTGR
ncbi:MAG TPA: zf-HC2 domain-containing protein, partial [Pyrinomonadaceae bacterium]|nr:zf-HC2 domain-containing protein [Pyrinomonadaceae bacterium]